jgi:hypothetical protein
MSRPLLVPPEVLKSPCHVSDLYRSSATCMSLVILPGLWFTFSLYSKSICFAVLKINIEDAKGVWSSGHDAPKIAVIVVPLLDRGV